MTFPDEGTASNLGSLVSSWPNPTERALLLWPEVGAARTWNQAGLEPGVEASGDE